MVIFLTDNRFPSYVIKQFATIWYATSLYECVYSAAFKEATKVASGLFPANNNKFEILPFLFDLDSTISMFSLKFLKELKYGAVTWGILPFVSDMKALFHSLLDLYSKVSTSSLTFSEKTASVKASGRYYTSYGVPANVNVNGQLRLNGKFFTSIPAYEGKIGKALQLLDEIGFHPDFKTAWDIIPLSFVLEYFIPIGSILESLHPRGWGVPVCTFDGWRSLKYFFDHSEGDYDRVISLQRAYGRAYYRERLTWTIPAADVSIEWKTPSLKELFNTAYLSTVLKKLF